MTDPSIRIEALTSVETLRQCVEIQRAIWGWKDEDLLPLRTLLLLDKIGGLVLGALDPDGQVLGFINAFPGCRDGKVYWHSQMLGVRKKFQHQGIGKRLKLAQRDEAIRRGIHHIEWTFDPFEIQNAQFNLERLGVICRRYLSDAYGPSTSSLHGRLPTDRLVAEWHLSSRRVRSRIEIHSRPSKTAPPEESVVLKLPANIGAVRAQNPARAAAIQSDFRSQATRLFQEGLCMTAFELASPPAKVGYHLVPFSPQVLDS